MPSDAASANLSSSVRIMKILINQFLQTEDPMAKAIRQAMRKKKMPQMAECITFKTDYNGTKGKD